MMLALEEARRAMTAGDVPVGAVLVVGGHVVAAGRNVKESVCDPTAHAEIAALREAARKAQNWRLSDATLYVTKEPCVMCAGAMVNARLGRLVFGCRDTKGGAVESLYRLLGDRRLNHQVDVTAGVLEEECAALIKGFFSGLRRRSPTPGL